MKLRCVAHLYSKVSVQHFISRKGRKGAMDFFVQYKIS